MIASKDSIFHLEPFWLAFFLLSWVSWALAAFCRNFSLASLVCAALAENYTDRRHHQSKVTPQRPLFGVLTVHRDTLIVSGIAAATDLPRAGQTGTQADVVT